MENLGIKVIFQGNNFLRILEGLAVTLKISIISIILSILLGIILGIIMTSKNKTIRIITKTINKNSTKWHLVRQKIGMVFQSYDLIHHKTIIENILLGPMKAQKRNRDEALKQPELLLEKVDLLDKKNAYPRQLSGGQK